MRRPSRGSGLPDFMERRFHGKDSWRQSSYTRAISEWCVTRPVSQFDGLGLYTHIDQAADDQRTRWRKGVYCPGECNMCAQEITEIGNSCCSGVGLQPGAGSAPAASGL